MAFSTFPSPRKLALPALKKPLLITTDRFCKVCTADPGTTQVCAVCAHLYVSCSQHLYCLWSVVGSPQMQRADWMHCSTCHFIQGAGASILGFWYLQRDEVTWNQPPALLPDTKRQPVFWESNVTCRFLTVQGIDTPYPALFNGEQYLFSRSIHQVISAIHSLYCSVVFHWDYLSIFQMMDIWAVSSLGLYINTNIFVQGLLWTYFSKVNT